MAYIQIPKNLKEIKNKVAFGFTLRQIIGIVVSGTIAIPFYLLIKTKVDLQLSMLLTMLIAFPIFFIFFYEKNGLNAEQILKNKILYMYYQPKKRFKKRGKNVKNSKNF